MFCECNVERQRSRDCCSGVMCLGYAYKDTAFARQCFWLGFPHQHYCEWNAFTIAPEGLNPNRKTNMNSNKAPEERPISPFRATMLLLWSFYEPWERSFYYDFAPPVHAGRKIMLARKSWIPKGWHDYRKETKNWKKSRRDGIIFCNCLIIMSSLRDFACNGIAFL